MEKGYQAPRVTVLGDLVELTAAQKELTSSSDGTLYVNGEPFPINTVS